MIANNKIQWRRGRTAKKTQLARGAYTPFFKQKPSNHNLLMSITAALHCPSVESSSR